MSKTLFIFDFDDTLITCDAQVGIFHDNGKVSYLSSAEFASYSPQKSDRFDFSEFEIYPPGGEIIPNTFRKLRTLLMMGEDIIILTAREKSEPVKQFLLDHQITQVPVFAVGSSDPLAKAMFVLEQLDTEDYDHVHLWEDNITNINTIKMVTEENDIRFTYTLVKHSTGCHGKMSRIKEFIKEAITQSEKKIPSAGIIVMRQFPEGWRVLGLRLYGKYDLPKGRIEDGEEALAAALRETEEEAGITSIDFAWGLEPIRVEHVTLFLGSTSQDPQIRPNPLTGEYEHHAASWLTWEELEKKISKYLRPAVALAKDIVKTDSRS